MRSRRTMAVMVGLVIVAMVATGAAGLFNALSTPPPQEDQAPPEDAPAMEALGGSPSTVGYVDLGQQCRSGQGGQPGECYRTVGLQPAEGEEIEAEDALEDVRGHLIDDGWEPLVPQGTDPEDVSAEEFVLSDGSVMAMASPVPADSSTPAAVVLAHY
ncbi:hypothetical protein [Nocardiopsis suaedae]|uniref:Secreted protein n=1 Tax=Nocardiopsis suaedae TaxID=3018444 RepID=A0ABT4TQI5_9ACTN|nr:hypothetical protein [Nocardiopsis suaedae]MDA2806948.1 hypothetical protein [Nocardiopsis suaedae]